MRRPRQIFLTTRSVFFAIAVHAVIAVLLLYNFNWKSEVIRPRAPQTEQPLMAKIVSEQEIQDQLATIKQEQDQKIKQERERKEQMLKQVREKEKKRNQEEQRLVKIKKKKEQEKKQLKLDQDKRKKEQQRLVKLKKQQQKIREAEQAKMQARIQGEQEKRKASDEFNKFAHMISEKVRRNWNRPSISGARVKPTVLVRFSSGGYVLSAQVTRSSGSEAMDRSVENAVRKASPLPIPTNPKYYKYYQDGVEFVFDPGDFNFS